jgi:hypothetical protein
VLLGGLAIATTPTDIFPEIDIPVVSVIWNYEGLPTEEMASRITTFSEYTISSGSATCARSSLVAADAVWVVPATALIARSAGSQVIAVRANGTVHYQGVQVGRDLGQSVEIVSGLTGNERLVISPPDGLKEGARVLVEDPKS